MPCESLIMRMLATFARQSHCQDTQTHKTPHKGCELAVGPGAGAKARVFELLRRVQEFDSDKALSRAELVIDGRTLSYILGAVLAFRALRLCACPS